MANTYAPETLGIKIAPGLGNGAWIQGRQLWNGTLSDPGEIHPASNQQGAGQRVSPEVNAQSAAQQGVSPQQFEGYLQQQRQKGAGAQPSTPFTGMPTGTTGAGDGSGVGFQSPEAINLPEIYQSLYDSSGVKQLQEELSGKAKAYSEQVAKIKDNPYLSEATMTGRLKKLDEKFNADERNVQNDIATRKADVETQLNLRLKQFDINSQQTKQAMDQFNALLSVGALDNASGQDIANITRSTGLSSAMIYSAINAQKQKNVQTSTISFDDGTNQGFAIINSQTGEIINKQTVSQSKPKAASVTEQKEADLEQTKQNLITDIQSGVTPRQLVPHYSGSNGISVDELYRLYNSYSPWGAAQESLDEFKEGKFVS